MSYGGLVAAATSSTNVVPRKGVNMSRVVAGEKRHGNVVCDLDGVLYRGEEAIEGAGGALTLLADAGFATLFVTNNSTQTPQDVVEKIRRLTGYSTTASQVIGSAQAAAHTCRRGEGDQRGSSSQRHSCRQ